ncbi:PIN domain-containing protein [bacterium]|nr:PIN domain-containing protein [bacterium]
MLAADLTTHPSSPNQEILSRWRGGELSWLVSEDIAAEYAEKLLERGNSLSSVKAFLEELFLLAETVEIRFFHFRHYPVDPDDTVFLLAALNGAATHLVSYDRHLLEIRHFYSEFETCGPIDFLAALRRPER